jgi:hypothetical protein
MTDFWLLKRDDTDVCSLFENPAIGRKLSTNPVAVRNVFNEEYAGKSVPLVLSGRYKRVPLGDPRWSIDVAFYGWISAFSVRAYELLLAHGCRELDFAPCHFTVMPELQFHSFLPRTSYDVVDVERSKFHMILPTEPPLPVGISSLTLRADVPKLPENFYAKTPGHEMVYGELLVSDSFHTDWIENRLTGASFEKVNTS